MAKGQETKLELPGVKPRAFSLPCQLLCHWARAPTSNHLSFLPLCILLALGLEWGVATGGSYSSVHSKPMALGLTPSSSTFLQTHLRFRSDSPWSQTYAATSPSNQYNISTEHIMQYYSKDGDMSECRLSQWIKAQWKVTTSIWWVCYLCSCYTT